MSDQLVQAVDNFTTQATALLDEYRGGKTQMGTQLAAAQAARTSAETAASTAVAKAAEAVTSASTASTHKGNAKVEADRAKTEADRAAQISGLDTVEAAVTLALAEGGYTWRTQADMEAMREVNNDLYAASGFVHMGKHRVQSGLDFIPVNQGLTVDTQYTPYGMYLGRRAGANITGNSSEYAPYINIAGFVTEIDSLGISGSSWVSKIMFPEAEAGTRTYDSATGISFDYAKEVDPKYGDIAPTLSEAVNRAFEGMVANGDFRLPLKDTSLGAWNGLANPYINIVNGVMVIDGVANGANLSVVQKLAENVKAGVTYRVSVTKKSGSGTSSANLSKDGQFDASLTITKGMDGAGTYFLDYTPTEDGALYIQMYGLYMYGGVSVGAAEFTNVSVRPLTNEIVTDRVDMWGFEGWMEQITPTNPYVYDRGLIQSHVTDIEGVATSYSNRPDSYYAAYDGDTARRGKGVNFFALSVLEQDAIANNPKNHIYRMKNGDICQWRVRQRTIAGAGNGDWTYLTDYTLLGFGAGCYVWAQGQKDTQQTYGSSTRLYVGDADALGRKRSTSKGIFDQVYDNTTGYNGMCHFLVGGTVSRLNQGGYHPSLNPMGASGWRLGEGDGNTHDWRSPPNVPWIYGNTMKTCFAALPSGSQQSGGGNWGGLIGQVSKRPDGKFYNAIYASGIGGVVDLRLSAWDTSSAEKAAEIDAQVKAGIYRGLEKLVFTDFIPQNLLGGGSSPDKDRKYGVFSTTKALGLYLAPWETGLFEIGDNIIVVDKTLSRIFKGKISAIGTATGYISTTALAQEWDTATNKWKQVDVTTNLYGTGNDVHVLVERKINLSVSGEFTQTNVIGDPAELLQCDALKNGWLGSWVPVIPNGVVQIKDFPFTRKNISATNVIWYKTSDNGATWSSTQWTPDGVKNNIHPSATGAIAANEIYLGNYSVFANQTVESARKPVLNGGKGLGAVGLTNSHALTSAVLLTESMCGLIGVDPDASSNGDRSLTNYNLMANNELSTGTGMNKKLTHAPLSLRSAIMPFVKFLPTQIAENGQASLNYVFKEVKVKSSVPGDDDTFNYVTGAVNTFTDLNGDTCLQGIAKLALPYGWIKNQN